MKRVKKLLASAAIVAALSVAAVWSLETPTIAGGETRTLSLYHVHTKESITVTYMVKGRYVPSAMKKINYLMRDWRRNEVVTIDPKTIDLIWELHADLGSRAPIHIVCGYRSPKTNAFLKRVGRNVAKKSQHMVGRAIDLYFPDVATKKIRNSALVRKIGGVGYYRSSGGPTGFVHLDSGNVRHWGPAIGKTEMAQIFRDGRKTLGARLNRTDSVAIASAEAEAAALESAYEGVDEDLAAMSEEASKTPPAPKPALVVPKEIVQGYPVPKPRPKPIEVLMMAAANMVIEPASTSPENQIVKSNPSVVADNLGMVEAAETMSDETALAQMSNAAAKGSFADAIRNGTAQGAPLIKPMMASLSSSDINWWPEELLFNPAQTVRQNGAPQDFTTNEISLVPNAVAQPVMRTNTTLNAQAGMAQLPLTSGKSDMLVVERAGKGSLPSTLPTLLKGFEKLGQLETD
ncbi:MAG: DUF882 domain-containing protein [Aestuariivirga sp.]|nr:DUF882 domain-containing protein [Aestuariivirga sp.]